MIGIYISPDNLTAELHAEGRRRLEAAGAPEAAMKLHAVFGEADHLMVFDIWESQEAWDAFLVYLMPVLQDLGVTMSGAPDIMPIVDLVTH